jgi:solute carrier family 9B (sodium/hydrogen exchanger), member 1/2
MLSSRLYQPLIFVLVSFNMLLGIFKNSKADIAWMIASMLISAITGIALGFLAGYLLYRLFLRSQWKSPNRTLALIGVSIFMVWLEKICSSFLPLSGLLAVMATGFMILDKSKSIAARISRKLKKIWMFAQIILFVMIGAQVNIDVAMASGLSGIFVVLTGLIFRSLGTYISLWGTGFSWQEKVFCVVCYLPKATVQAAIGAMPLAAGIVSGEVILAVAVLSIIITAPAGAIAITLLGEKVLDRSEGISP